MAKIKNETEYRKAMERIDELLPLVHDDTPVTDKNYVELDLLSDLVEEYEDVYYPISKPSLAETIKLRMYEMGLTSARLSSLLGITPSSLGQYLNGEAEPSLSVARAMSKELNISPAIVLGV
ncbi:MAG: helix-turn-helix domain-containing protein [Bacteroidaceae bacterium]|nr:helix-turn-helix domain-containing protein [Bacteroidaceae bacterium]